MNLPRFFCRRLTPLSLCFTLLVLHELVAIASGLKWLSLAKMSLISTIERADACENLTGLSKRQVKICKKHLEVMNSVKSGASLAIVECGHQFRSRRWNCSTLHQGTLFGNVLNQGTREAAFVHALSSASVSHSVTKSCSTGGLTQCGCDRTVSGRHPEGFEWAGCSDNVAFGSAFSRTFVDARERARGDKSSRALMNLHNNEAGRKAVEENMQIQCKCHGVSGSCELKTCWKAMPSFRQVGNHLKEKFDGASEVQEKRDGPRRILVGINPQYKPPTDQDLVYLEASPDFCDHDPKTGSLGTTGRLCNKGSKTIDGCDLMCCGRGFKTRRKIVTERCHCKFHWCCYVKCSLCKREVEEHICL